MRENRLVFVFFSEQANCPSRTAGSVEDGSSDGSIYRYRIDIAILGSRYYRIDIAILRSRYFCFRYSNMNTLISILIVKMQVSTINYLKFLSTPTRWSVGRSNEQSVDRSVGRPVGHLNGRSVGQSVN